MHDWAWPPDAAGLRAMTARGLVAWIPDGLGAPNAFPTVLPQFYLEWLLSWVLSPKVVLDALLLATFTLGILGAAFAARTLLALESRWALVCGFFYMAGPVTLAKFVAGHTSYLEAYAVLPFFVGLALQKRVERRRLWLILSALALAFSSVQLQIFGLEVLVLLLGVVFRRRTPKEAALIALVALPIVLPAIFGALVLSRPTHGALSMQRAVLTWQLQQSVPPLEATQGRGYFVHYYELLTPFWLQHVLLIFPLCALFGLAGLRREMRTAALLVTLALIAWLTATGLRGPLHALWSQVFLHVSVSSLYRELYDVMALYWLICVLLAASFWREQRAVAWLFVVFGLWATLPSWVGAPALLGWAPPATAIAQLDEAANRLPPGRILWWPAQQPLGPPNRPVGGADPLAYTPLAGDKPIFEYQPYGLFAAALTEMQQGRWHLAEPLFSQLGIVAIGDRADIASFVSGRATAAKRIPRNASRTLLPRIGNVQLAVLKNAASVLSLQKEAAFTQLPEPFDRSVANNVPGKGRLVAAYPYYWMTPAIGLCGPSSVLGFRDDLLRLQRKWYFIAPLTSQGSCRWISRLALARWSSNALLVGGGGAGHPLPTPSTARPQIAGLVTVQHASSDEIEGTMRSATAGVLVFRNDFDPRWTLMLEGKKTAARLVEGFANGWTVPAGIHHFAVEFSPTPYLRVALVVGFTWLIVLLYAIARSLRSDVRGETAAH